MPVEETWPRNVVQSLGPRVNHLGSNPSLATYWVGDLEEVTQSFSASVSSSVKWVYKVPTSLGCFED